jgi:ParB family transcriptional regulator, chromosome partitioning protein
MAKKVLGRGLDVLIPRGAAGAEPRPGEVVRSVPTASVRPNPRQPRRQFNDERLAELAHSIREKGIIEPLIVRQAEGAEFELIAGERRLRAAQLAGLEEVPVLLRRSADRESLEIALIENLQREDLNPVDEARAYLRLSEEFGRTHAEISQEVGKDRTTVTNLLRILRLPQGVLDDVSRGTLSVGHARVLLGVEHPGRQADLARRMVAEGWNVRQAERFVSQINKPAKVRGSKSGTPSRGGEVVRIEEALRYALGAEVHLDHGASGGRIEICYQSNEELERILELLGIQIH